MDVTQEWAENNYYHLPIQQQLADLVGVNPFWLDYARHDGKTPFLSRHLAEAAHNFTEMMFALAVLDLPFEAAKHQSGRRRRPHDPDSRPVPSSPSMRRFGRPPGLRDRCRSSSARISIAMAIATARKTAKRSTSSSPANSWSNTVYGCQVVVTNPTSSRQKLNVLLQVPIGAIPVSNGQPTRTVLVDLEPYRTQTIDYFFYFPLPGKFAHFPVNVAKNERFLAAAAPVVLDVVEKPSKLDTSSWDYVSQNGTNEEVLAFLNRENVFALNLEKIAFRMKDRAFFTQCDRSFAEPAPLQFHPVVLCPPPCRRPGRSAILAARR